MKFRVFLVNGEIMNFEPLINFLDHLTSWRIPGNCVCVYKDGKKVFSYESGYANLEKQISMTPDRLFYIYSCSKVATVTAALQLYEKGLFLLDDPVYDFIPEYKDITIIDESGNLAPSKKPMTLRHLFTMTSGLSYDTCTPAFKKARELTDGNMDTLTLAKCLAETTLSFEPGKHWQYSLSHDVLAAVVEVASGKRFKDYVRENIFKPLEMKSTVYHIGETTGVFAEQYHFKNSDETDIGKLQTYNAEANSREGGYIVNRGLTNVDVFGTEYDSGGAGVISTVGDYAKLCCALSNGGIGATGEQILKSNTIDLLRTNQLNEQQLKDFNWPQLKGYGYGLGVRTMMDTAKGNSNGNIGEFGWGGAAGATVLVDPKEKLGVFYAHHMLNPQEEYYQPRLRNAVYESIK